MCISYQSPINLSYFIGDSNKENRRASSESKPSEYEIVVGRGGEAILILKREVAEFEALLPQVRVHRFLELLLLHWGSEREAKPSLGLEMEGDWGRSLCTFSRVQPRPPYALIKRRMIRRGEKRRTSGREMTGLFCNSVEPVRFDRLDREPIVHPVQLIENM